LRQVHTLSLLLEAAELSRSTFYYQNHVLAHPDQDEADLRERIRAIYDQSQGRYGYRTVTLELANQGHRTNHKRVQRLMGGDGPEITGPREALSGLQGGGQYSGWQ